MAFSSPVKHVFPRKKIRKKKNRTTHLTWDISFWRQSVSLYFSFFFRTNVTPPNLRFPNSHMTEREKLNNSIWSEKKVLLRASSVWHFVFFFSFFCGEQQEREFPKRDSILFWRRMIRSSETFPENIFQKIKERTDIKKTCFVKYTLLILFF